jgi:L-iditol 2-dehydrogenase
MSYTIACCYFPRFEHAGHSEVDLESAALTEPLACTIHGVLSVAKVQAGENVAIAGPGPIGLLALQLAKAAGASVALLGTEADRARLELARQLGVGPRG